MRPDDLPRIRELPLFSSMSEENFLALTKAAYLQHFPPQVELIHEGDPADFLYVVVEGAVELFARANGRESSMSIIRPVGTFILAAVLKDAVYLMSARTTTKSRVLMIPAENIRTVFNEDEAFARSIVEELATCYRAVVKDHKGLKLRSGVERLANRLIRFRDDQNANGSIELPYDKRTLASLLGMTPENLSRAFNTLRPYGVKVEGSMIHLEDMDSLETLAKVNPLIDDRTT